jgi:hypothetical protein
MVTKLIEAYAAAFPVWETLLGTAGIVVISTFYLYKDGWSIGTALLLQFMWFLVPILVVISEIKQSLEVAGHIGSGVMLGVFLAVLLYAASIGLKKSCRNFSFLGK